MPAPSPLTLARRTWRRWRDEHATRQGAGLAFYALFSVAPAVMVTTWVLDPAVDPWALLLPSPLVDTTHELVARTQEAAGKRWIVLAAFALVYAPVRGLMQLQATLNELWGIRAVRGPGPSEIVRRKLLALSSVAGTLALLFGSAMVSGVVAKVLFLGDRLNAWVLITLLVGAVFRTLPDARVAWRDVLVGAAVTAALLLVGREALGAYLQTTTRTLAFGAAGPVVAILLFTYYSAQVLLFGASFTWALADEAGRPIAPGPDAVRLVKTRLPD